VTSSVAPWALGFCPMFGSELCAVASAVTVAKTILDISAIMEIKFSRKRSMINLGVKLEDHKETLDLGLYLYF
jgi:hypothetical protein